MFKVKMKISHQATMYEIIQYGFNNFSMDSMNFMCSSL